MIAHHFDHHQIFHYNRSLVLQEASYGIFEGALLRPELGTIYGNPLGYINETNLGISLSTSESIVDGTNDGLLDEHLDGIILGNELYLNMRSITCIFTGSFARTITW